MAARLCGFESHLAHHEFGSLETGSFFCALCQGRAFMGLSTKERGLFTKKGAVGISSSFVEQSGTSEEHSGQ